MKRVHWILITALLLVIVVAALIFWTRPVTVDMSAYAPANSLLYMEANDPLAVVHAVVNSDAWKLAGTPDSGTWATSKGWMRSLMRTTGIGPVESVILSRAQVAIVVTDLGTTEDGQTLRVKPEFALIIETQTSEGRIRSVAEKALQQLAAATFTKSTARRTFVNGIEFLEWRNEDQTRQVVGAIVGSLVVIGNTESAVQRCLDSAAKRAPSLKEDQNLHLLRRDLSSSQALTFGYVPEAKSAQLLSFAVPLVLGRAPSDEGFQKLISTAATKLFSGIAWSSRSFQNGIEDRYLISLRPAFLREMQSSFRTATENQPKQTLPLDSYSVTYYKLENPLAAWEALRTSVAANTDVLSAVIFSSLLKSALLSYGLSQPQEFLQSVGGNITTLRLDAAGDQTLLFAQVKNREALRALVTKTMKLEPDQPTPNSEFFSDSQNETGAFLTADLIAIGQLHSVRRYSQTGFEGPGKDEQARRMTAFFPTEIASPILTYSDDRDRVRRFFDALRATSGAPPNDSLQSESMLDKLPYAATQSKMVDKGLERTTRSPLGQFSSLLPLLIPEQRSSTASPPSR